MSSDSEWRKKLEVYAAETGGEDTLAWARKHEWLSVNETAIEPSIFLPEEGEKKGESDLEVILYDIAVKPPRRRKAIPGQEDKNPRTDDAVYCADAEIRRRVPRGLTLVEVRPWKWSTPGHGSSNSLIFPAVFAMRKFTGDEDDDQDEAGGDGDGEDENAAQPEWKQFFIRPVETATEVLRTDKANGEAAHFACLRLWNGVQVLFCGSKKTHVAFKSLQDLDRSCYASERFQFAKRVARGCWKLLYETRGVDAQRLLNYLSSNFFTATFEYLQPDYMHVELFDFPEPKLKFIAFTTTPSSGSRDEAAESLCRSPVESFKLAIELGLDPVAHELYPASKLEELAKDIRNVYGKEGSVLYVIDDKGRVIGLVKKKAIWYIVLRALREKCRGFVGRVNRGRKHRDSTNSVSRAVDLETVSNELNKTQNATRKRMKELQSWLGFSANFAEAWTSLAMDFLKHLSDILRNPTESAEYQGLQKSIQGLFPRLWNDFLKANHRTDRLSPFEEGNNSTITTTASSST